MAGRFPAGMPTGRRSRGRLSHHPTASTFALQHSSQVAQGTPSQPNPRLDRSGLGDRGNFVGTYIHALQMIPFTWPFVVWSLDLVGPLQRAASGYTHTTKFDP